METLFRFASGDIVLEIQGSDDFVRRELAHFRAWLGGAPPAPPVAAEPEEAPDSLKGWYKRTVPPKMIPTMQDSVLIFAYYLNRVKRQFIFVPDDMKAGFHDVGREIPKSLLQIMGSLKRDSNLLYAGEKRGEYCLTPQGLKYVEGVLGLKKPEPEDPRVKAAEERLLAATAKDAPAKEAPARDVAAKEASMKAGNLREAKPETPAARLFAHLPGDGEGEN